MQDSKGFIWFCTDAGISRYDGYSFKNFSMEDGLPDNSVFELIEDKAGRIWTRTHSGNICYILNDSIYQIAARVEKQMNPTSFVINEKGEISIGLYNMEGYMTSTPPYSTFIYEPVSSSYYIREIENDKFIYGFSNKEKTNKVDLVQVFSKGKTSSTKWNLKETSYDTYKCLRIAPNHYLISLAYNLYEIENGIVINEKELEHPIIHLSFDKSNGLWMGTKGGGALFYKSGNPFKGDAQHFFGSDNVSCILIDKEGATWVTTTGKGVYYIHSKNINVLDTKHGLPDNELVCLEMYNDTSMFVAGKNGIFSLVSATGRIIKKFDPKSKGITYITHLKKLNDSQVILCSDRTYILNINSMTLDEIRSERSTVFSRKAIVNRDHLISAGFSNLFNYDLISKKLKIIPVDFKVLSIAHGAGDTVWLGCRDGLRYLLDTVIYKAKDANNIFSDIEDLLYKNQKLYIASKSNGLLIKAGNSVIQLNRSNGLKSEICKRLTVDDQNLIWVVTNAGISKVSPNKEKFSIENIDYLSGLPTFEINQILFLKERLFAASNMGLLTLERKTEEKINYTVPVYITQVYLNNSAISNQTDFKYDQNYFSFDFVGLSYKKNKRQVYRYELKGLNGDQKYTSATSVQYPALPPGNYTFAVTVVNEKNKVIGQTVLYPFIIQKPFWKEGWFIFSSLLLLALIVFVLVKQKIKQEKEKEQFKTQIAETELKALRAQMNPHFIFDTINSIQNFILKNEKEPAYDYLSRFSQLIRNVLEFSKTESISLEQELATLELYMQLEALRFDEQFDYKIEIDASLNPGSAHIPAMLIQPYIENAIWHGIMHSEVKGKIIIKLSKQGKLIHCTIDDNGIGRKRSAELKSANILKHKSIGMEVTAERISILGKTMGAETKVEIEDKHDETGLAIGTRVILHIPILKE